MGRKVAQILEHHYTAGNKCMETLGLTDVPVDLLRVAKEEGRVLQQALVRH